MIIPEGSAPESWACIDCGFDTAPGCNNRGELEQAFSVIRTNHAAPQTIDKNSEIYMVKSTVWKATGMKDFGGCLCIGCLEKRIGRKLRPKDFMRDHVFNTMPGTERLLSRRGG
jgi:hypothetical protein